LNEQGANDMSRTPITVYLDFRTASAIKARADGLAMSQSQWLGDCARKALAQDSATAPAASRQSNRYPAGTGARA
jgi:hypothetical protein